MALDIGIPPVEQRKLLDVDPSGDTWARIRQARHREGIEHLKMLFTPAQIPYLGTMAEVRAAILSHEDPSDELKELFTSVLKLFGTIENSAPGILLDELYTVECWLTFEECNLQMGGKPLFTAGMKHDRAAFEKAYALLPPDVARNWQQEVWEVNPDWHPFPERRESAESKSEMPSEST